MQKYNNFYMSIIDIKQVEFLQYKEAVQLATPIVTTVSRCYELLENYITIMNNRYNLLSQKGYKNIDEYNSKEELIMYRHVIVIDELANVLLDNKLIIKPLQKLLQLGRAVGIHLILATQAPNCKTVPTELKINITCRIGLQVPTAANSKIILDEKGAELLKGCGDAIIKNNNISERFQVAFTE